MTIYPHPAAALAVFQARLSADIGADNTSYTLACSAARPLLTNLSGDACQDWSAVYNSEVDMVATGGLVGEVDHYPYNRLNLADIVKAGPYLAGAAVTLADLLPQINAASGFTLLPQDILASPIPDCDCTCGPIGMTLSADPNSLLFYGSVTIYVTTLALPLNTVVLQPFLPALPLPTLTP